MIKFVSAAAALSLLVAGGAQARSHDQADADGRSVATVNYSGIDMSSEAGARAFLTRLDTAIAAVCHKPDWQHSDQLPAFQSCRTEALTRAVQSVNQPVVTRIAGMQVIQQLASR